MGDKEDDYEMVPITAELANKMFSFRGGRWYAAKPRWFSDYLPVE